MELTYRTLQRPESDIIGWTVANRVKKAGKHILRINQGKTDIKCSSLHSARVVVAEAVVVSELVSFKFQLSKIPCNRSWKLDDGGGGSAGGVGGAGQGVCTTKPTSWSLGGVEVQAETTMLIAQIISNCLTFDMISLQLVFEFVASDLQRDDFFERVDQHPTCLRFLLGDVGVDLVELLLIGDFLLIDACAVLPMANADKAGQPDQHDGHDDGEVHDSKSGSGTV